LFEGIDCDVIYTDPSFRKYIENSDYLLAQCPHHRSKKSGILFYLGLIPEWRGKFSKVWLWFFLRKSYSTVYVFLYSANVLKFASWISDCKKSRLVIHIADHSPSFFYDNDFQSILKKADKVACIGRNMREKYNKFFNRNFKVFHNLADDSYLPLTSVKNVNFSYKNPFKILFIGSLFYDLHSGAIEDVCDAVVNLNQQGYSIELHLYGQLFPLNFLSNHINGVSVFHHGIISAEERFRVMDEHHTFIIPASFDADIANQYCYSIPTKLPELLSSGRPTIVYGPKRMEAYRFCKEYECGILISERSIESIKSKLIDLLKSYNTHNANALDKANSVQPMLAKSIQLPRFRNFILN